MLQNPAWENETSRILKQAADLIDERGLAKFRQLDGQGRLCLHGAISMAIYGTVYEGGPECRTAGAAVGRFLKNRGDEGWSEFGQADWNNKPDRTKEEVVNALRGAACMVTQEALQTA